MNIASPQSAETDLIASTVATFNARTAASKQHASDARAVLADKSPMAMQFSPQLKEAFYPITVPRAKGAALWDLDGNQYIDILMGLGSNLLGHNPQFIQDALSEQLQQGFPIGPQAERAAETASLFCKLTKQDRVAFTNTGTEAVMTAVRVARAATGRRKIAIFTNSYHGHSDIALHKARRFEYIRRGALMRAHAGPLRALRPLLQRLMFTSAIPGVLGIPAAQSRDIVMLEYNNPHSLDILRRKGHKIAAILVEPVQSRVPEIQPRAFLQELRKVADHTGSALIFDEMISGFRAAPGGAQEFFGIEADLATYGKIAGGGLPLSIIAGKNRFMDHIDGGAWQFGDASAPQIATTYFAGTYCRHPLALRAAHAMAQHLVNAGPQLQTDLNSKTAKLVSRLNADCKAAALPVCYTCFGSFFAIAQSQSRISQDAVNLLSLLLLNQGIHLRAGDRGGFLSTAHSDEAIRQIAAHIVSSLCVLADNGFLTRQEAT